MWRNNARKAALLGIALNPPAFHPFNPLLALRVSSLPLSAEQGAAAITALLAAVWVERLHVSEPEVVSTILERAGLPGRQLVAEAQQAEVKSRLREQTDAAIACGVFGVPTMIVGDELFWGYDDFPYLEMHLTGRDPVEPFARAVLPEAPQASARRRRFRGQ